MPNHELDISREITDEDLSLYRKLGYNKAPGELTYVAERRGPRYRSWEDLMADANWVQSLLSSDECFSFLVERNMQTEDTREQWVKQQQRHQQDVLSYLEEADSVSMEVNLDAKPLTPSNHLRFNSFRFNSYQSEQQYYPIRLGEVIAVSKPSMVDTLYLANARPWGSNGGLQKLADIIKKPVIGKVNSRLTQEFLPSLSVL